MRQIPEQVIARRLVPGEKLLWSGAPPSGIRVRSADRLLVPFGLFGCSFASLDVSAPRPDPIAVSRGHDQHREFHDSGVVRIAPRTGV